MGRKTPPIKQRFLSKVDFSSSPIGCWIWKGSFGGFDPNGNHAYGRFWFMEKNVMAHKFSYEFIGDKIIPEGFQVDHLCKNQICVNPNHLQAVSQKENSNRSNNPMGINSRRTECIRGHPLSGINLYIAKNGTRKCKTCIKIRNTNFRKTGSYSIP